MIPTTTVLVDALPLTSLGKVDRRSLPDPDMERAETVLARDDLEADLAAIWSEVLAIHEIGVTEDFGAGG